MIKVKRALISVSDKTGLVEFARGLAQHGIEILSTGGTARALRNAGVTVVEVSEYTGYPEMLEGRVKTLHPVIHGGILALRDNEEHMKQLAEHHIGAIDMVVVNLYPFERVIQKKNVSLEEAVENIDIGGPSMLRSAAKNFKSVAVVCNPQKYKDILRELSVNSGILSDRVLTTLALEAFYLTSRYDSIIATFLHNRFRSADFSQLPKEISLWFSKVQDLRYGENSHQVAAFYRTAEGLKGLAALKQLHGKELSFNNMLDLQAAVDIVKDFDGPAATIIKHNNPTGTCESRSLSTAYRQARSCDPVSAFGGIIGLNRTVDAQTAACISKSGFMECVIAPGYERGALTALKQKKNLRIIQVNLDDFRREAADFKRVCGGFLLQDKDNRILAPDEMRAVTTLKPTRQHLRSMAFGWKAIKHVKSNAIILVKNTRTVGIGCGQTSRVESALTAIKKAGKNAKGAVLISDAFVPKIDTVQLAAKAGIAAIIQSGGSIADEDVIKAANKAKIAMVMTGIRHFKH